MIEPKLSATERESLLQLARDSIVQAVHHQQLPVHIPRDGIFAERRGVFVTVHVAQKLRGCIGVVEPSEPLGEAVVRCAACAALHDPRFSTVASGELSDLQIEISLLSKPLPIRPETIEVGRHGLLIVSGAHRGLLLPQVAVEHHLSPEQFLAETCRKAQLPPQAWRDPMTSVLAFTCEIFSERATK